MRGAASRYASADIADDLRKLLSANSEIAVHGIDAWRDSAKGRDERERVREVTGTVETGVRMHWLYFDLRAPSILENAGFSYDSTAGYNETIGYRAGTTQVFKHLSVDRLLELPLHIMDTALFYPSYMNLSDNQARTAMLPLIENATKFGGVLTINWHDRSLGPERLWGDVYANLLHDLRARKPWFATATQAVSGFASGGRYRSPVTTKDGRGIRVEPATDSTVSDLPPLTARVYNSGVLTSNLDPRRHAAFQDFILNRAEQVLIAA